MTTTNKTVYILDSYGLIYRAYYAFINRPLTNKEGKNISAIFGFFRAFLKILQDYSPEYFIAALDSKTPTFRHNLYTEYKATRQKTPDDLKKQIPIIENILETLGIHVVRHDGFEADDVIATIAKQCETEGFNCCILTGDKDLMQLVNGTTSILKPDKDGGWKPVDEQGVFEEWGVTPLQMKDMLSLLGDTADNIPGVKGIGEKTAQKLLAQYETLENIYNQIDDIKGSTQKKLIEGKESAFFSSKLVELCTTVPLNRKLSDFHTETFFYKEAAELLHNTGAISVAKAYAEKGLTDDTPRQEQKTEYHRKNVQFEVVTDLNKLHEQIDRILEKGYCAVQCFTNDPQTPNSTFTGFSFSSDEQNSFYVPFVSAESGLLDGPDYIQKKDAVKELSGLFSKKGFQVITFTGKHDYETLKINGLENIECDFKDTAIAEWLLTPEKSSFSLESSAENYFETTVEEQEDFFLNKKNPNKLSFSDFPIDKAAPFAAKRANTIFCLWNIFSKKLTESNLINLFTEIEMKLLPILGEMELQGIHIEKDKMLEYNKELTEKIQICEKKIFELTGHEFNISSPKQIQTVLFEERHLPHSKKTKTGYSTNTEILEELAEIDEVPEKILEYRMLSKLKSTYTETLPFLADANSRIHTNFLQTGTATGRLSSKDPNLQNIPVREESGRKIRSAFSTEKGFSLITADYSQIELVVLAHITKDSNLQNSFNSGVDIHKATAGLIFGAAPENVTSEMRRTAKTINFGVIYGMSAFRLSKTLGISRTQAQQFIDTYFNTYNGVKDFIASTIENAEKNGYVETLFGRRRYIPSINTSNKTEKAAAERIAVNTPIQGTAADIVKKAMISVSEKLREEKLKTKLILQVHDELILESPEGESQAVISLLKETMENVVKLDVPLKVSVEAGNNWGLFHS